MSSAFVWFHNSSKKPSQSVSFYQTLLGWAPTDGPPGMTLFASPHGPFAAVGTDKGSLGWVPFAEVADVDVATQKAQELGAAVVEAKQRGPAGEFTIIQDPGGATLALWQKA
jgi:hypothetical protein